MVDARASGCKIICSSSGGTQEIAGKDAVVIADMDWDLKPFELYKPPSLNFYQKISNKMCDHDLDIHASAKKYLSFFKEILI